MAPLVVDNLSFSYGARAALTGVSFDIAENDICGLLGPNGSGKSTLFRIAATLVRPQSGTVRILGLDVREHAAEIRAKIGVVFQTPSLDKRLTAAENLRCQGRLYGLAGRELDSRIDEVLERVELRDRRNEFVAQFSGGQQRRIELAKSLLHRPRVLLLDEPSTGLDPGARRAFREHLRKLREADGLTALLTTHFMEEADACDRLVLMDHGRIVQIGTPVELKQQIAGDCVVLQARDLDGLATLIQQRLGLRPMRVADSLRIEHERGHELIARLVELAGPQIDSVTLARPTLEDVFLDKTGHRLDEPQSGGYAA